MFRDRLGGHPVRIAPSFCGFKQVAVVDIGNFLVKMRSRRECLGSSKKSKTMICMAKAR